MALPRTPALAIDCVIFDPVGRVLLIRRGHAPSVGCHALPGGFVKLGETVEALPAAAKYGRRPVSS
jgi:8-oxo-dGTP diphosphatase